jgi:hypothetical protein
MTEIEEIKEHIKTINDELGYVKNKMTEIKTDVAWLKKFFWIVATASIASLIAQLIKF